MVNLINVLVAVPTGLWEKIIFAFNGAVKNYALAIILLTLCIKLILLPVDFINRRSTAKMTEVQTKLQPKMAEIQRKYPDKNIQNQKLGELYQKEGFNPMGSCLTMLIVMGITMGVFFTLFSGLNSMASYKIVDQYEQLQKAYVAEYVVDKYNEDIYSLTDEEFQEKIDNYIIEIYTYEPDVDTQADWETRVSVANDAVATKYDEVREGFLWIKNVWIPDTPFARAIPDFTSYAKTAGLSFENDTEKALAESIYNAVMGELEKAQGVNGYFILAVLAGVTSFLSQYLLSKKKKQKDNFYTKQQENQPMTQQASTNKAMMIVFPIIMLVFTLSYNSVFALYIVTGQLFTMATTPLVSKLIELSNKKKDKVKN